MANDRVSIPILKGVYTKSQDANYRVSFPINLNVIAQDSGISDAYLLPAPGVTLVGTGPGPDRGGIAWNNSLFRVMGSQLVEIQESGNIAFRGDVGNNNLPVSMAFNFDNLIVCSNEKLWFYNTTDGLREITSANLGKSLFVVWDSGYILSSDGKAVVNSNIQDPTTFSPTNYLASNEDPSPLVGMLRWRNQVYTFNRYTTQVIAAGAEPDVTKTPYQVQRGATIPKGTVGSRSFCIFQQNITFLGNAINESPAVYVSAGAELAAISDREVSLLLQSYTEDELASVILEPQESGEIQRLFMHLPDRTLVYDATASARLQTKIWTELHSGKTAQNRSKYRAQNLVWCYNRWNVGDPSSNTVGFLTNENALVYNAAVPVQFSTQFGYLDGKDGFLYELELALNQTTPIPASITVESSIDGQIWTTPLPKTIKKAPYKTSWLNLGRIRGTRTFRFTTDSSSFCSFAKLLSRVEIAS